MPVTSALQALCSLQLISVLKIHLILWYQLYEQFIYGFKFFVHSIFCNTIYTSMRTHSFTWEHIAWTTPLQYIRVTNIFTSLPTLSICTTNVYGELKKVRELYSRYQFICFSYFIILCQTSLYYLLLYNSRNFDSLSDFPYANTLPVTIHLKIIMKGKII